MDWWFLWLIVGTLPGGTFPGWAIAGVWTNAIKYYLYAILYAAAYFLLIALLFVFALTQAPFWLGFPWFLLVFGLWWGGFAHMVFEREEVVLRRKFYLASQALRKQEPPAPDRIARIRREYGLSWEDSPTGSSASPASRPAPRSSAQVRPAPPGRPEPASSPENDVYALAREIMSPFPGYEPLEIPKPKPEPRAVDLNQAARETIAAIPSVGMSLALTIVRNREESGPFRSLDDLCLRCAVKPHIRLALEPHVVFGAGETSAFPNSWNERPSSPNRKARRID